MRSKLRSRMSDKCKDIGKLSLSQGSKKKTYIIAYTFNFPGQSEEAKEDDSQLHNLS